MGGSGKRKGKEVTHSGEDKLFEEGGERQRERGTHLLQTCCSFLESERRERSRKRGQEEEETNSRQTRSNR